MSVDFTQPPSSASVPDASESVKGKIRIATSAEATAGTDDLTAMTPLKVQSVVNTALVGGVTYQGTFDASSPADLSNATKGDLYIISVAGTYAGKTWAVGDHLLVNADMGGTLDSAKIDKVDNTEAVSSVAGRTGAVTLDLNDLTDVAFTAGLGIDNYVLTYNNSTGLWGAEASKKNFYKISVGSGNIGFAAETENVCKYYSLYSGGTELTIPNAASNNVIGGLVTIRNTSTSTNTVVCPSANLADGTTVTTFDLEPEEARSFVWTSVSTWEEISASSLGQLANVDLTGLANGDVLIYNSTSGKWEAGSTPATSVALDDLTDVTITAASTGEVLRYDGAEWVDAQLAYSDLSGTPTLATVASTGAYSDLSGTPTNVSSFTNDAGYLTDITAENLGDLADVDLTGLADGEIIIYNSTSGKWEANPPPAPAATETSAGLIEIATNAEATAGTTTDKALVPSNISSIATAQLDNSAGTMLESANNLSDLANAATARTNLGLATVASTGAYSDLSGAPTNVSSFTNDAGYISDITAENLGDLADVDLTGLADGEIIIYNATSGNWEANPPPAPQATTTSVGLIEIAENAEATAGTATDKALVPSNISSITTAQLDNSAGTLLESANNLSDLANAATARTNLGLGTSATLDVGTSANNVVQLNGSAQLPAVDGSLLTGVVADLSGASVGDLSDVTITAAASGEVLRYNGTAWVDAQLDYADITGLGTAAPLDAGTSAGNVVQLNGSAQLPALDGSLLTGVTADLSSATLDGLSDVSYPVAPTKDQLLQWNSTSSKWEPVDATTVTSDSPGSTYLVTTHKGLEEVYLLSPSTSCTVTIPTAADAGAGYKYYIKNLSANVLTINATIDGQAGFDLSNQYSAVTLVSDGSGWYII